MVAIDRGVNGAARGQGQRQWPPCGIYGLAAREKRENSWQVAYWRRVCCLVSAGDAGAAMLFSPKFNSIFCQIAPRTPALHE